MTQNQTVIVAIVLLFYLVGLGIFLNEIGKTVPIEYTSEDTFIFSDTFLGNIVNGVQSLPLWMNTIFIIMPSVLLGVTILLLVLHG